MITNQDILNHILFILFATVTLTVLPHLTVSILSILTLLMLVSVAYGVYIDVTEQTILRKFINSKPYYIHLLMFMILINSVIVVHIFLP